MKNAKPKILITAPSLDETCQVSGISSVVRQIIENGNFSYRHFVAGRSDGERKTIGWIARQIALPFRFFRTIRRETINLAHINTAFNPLSILRDFTLVKAAKLAGARVVLHIHGGEFLANEFRNKWLERIAGKMLGAADEVIVLSPLEKDIIGRRWQNIDANILENAVKIFDLDVDEKLKDSILFLGRLHESKGLHEIIEAIRILKLENFEFTFRAFGAGEMQELFVGEMTKLLGKDFYFGGVIAGEEKVKELRKADIFILPSRYGEGLPMAMLEAMAAKCVVILSEMASIGSVIRDGENGFLIEPKNTAQLTEKLRMILSSKSDFGDLRDNARQTIVKKFNLPNFINRLEDIYKSLNG